jgi:hypothetical protein
VAEPATVRAMRWPFAIGGTLPYYTKYSTKIEILSTSSMSIKNQVAHCILVYSESSALLSMPLRCSLPPSLCEPNDRICEDLCPVHLHALEQCSTSCTSFPTQYGSVTISSQALSGASQVPCQALSKACGGWGSGK